MRSCQAAPSLSNACSYSNVTGLRDCFSGVRFYVKLRTYSADLACQSTVARSVKVKARVVGVVRVRRRFFLRYQRKCDRVDIYDNCIRPRKRCGHTAVGHYCSDP